MKSNLLIASVIAPNQLTNRGAIVFLGNALVLAIALIQAKLRSRLKILEKAVIEENKFNQAELKKLINEASPHYEQLRKLNQSLGVGIGLLGIVLSLGATISGIIFKDDAKIAAIFGACAATTQALLFAYPTERRSRTYRVLVAKNENLRTELEVRQQTEEELQKILDEFKSIRVQAALEEAVPRKTEETEELLTSSPTDSSGSPSASNGNAASAVERAAPEMVNTNKK